MVEKVFQLGEIKVGERIGGGGFGEVFEAQQEPLNQNLAIKIFNPSPFQNSEEVSLERFFQEAEILMSLRHRYITPIYGFGEREGTPYILMERFKGVNFIQAREKHGNPDPKKVLVNTIFLANALAYAHDRDVVHRDIKPSNLLTIEGDARVIDFGIAKRINFDGKNLTTDGNTINGDAFAPPELHAQPRLVDPRCDIYSLGASWFWVLTGATPNGMHFEQKLRALPGVSKEYLSVVLKCLDAPNVRYQTMKELERDLIELRDGGIPDVSKTQDVDDVAALILGTVFDHCTRIREPISIYRAQQELNHLVDFDFSIGINQLDSRGLVLNEEVPNYNNDVDHGLAITDAGREWVVNNNGKIRSLQEELKKEQSTPVSNPVFDDDIPF